MKSIRQKRVGQFLYDFLSSRIKSMFSIESKVLRNGLIGVALISLFATSAVRSAQAQTVTIGAQRMQHVEMTYITADNYYNRLVNAEAAFNQLQLFLQTVNWQIGIDYSFLGNVIGGSFNPDNGYVMTEKGFAYGACGASSLLNRLVKSTTFKDADGKDQPVFQTVVDWTWTGDKTYGPYGAPIYLDKTGKRKTKDYIWQINSAYPGLSPQITLSFDPTTNTAGLTMTYSDALVQ